MAEEKEKLSEVKKEGKGEYPVNGKNDSDKNKKSKVKSIIFALIIVIILAVAFWYWYQGTLGHVSTDDAYIDANKLSLSSKMLGRIVKLYADEGDDVKKGEVLVKLDSTDIIAQKKQAEAALILAEENVKLSKINLEKTMEDFNRSKSQFQNKIIPKEQFDHAQKALQAAQAGYDISKAKIKSAQAELSVINTRLNDTFIKSPMKGRVAKKWVLTGDVVQPGQPIFSIYNLDSVWVTAQLQETDLEDVKPGENVDISVDTYRDKKFKGKVFQIGSNTASQFSLIPPNNASGNFTKVTQRVPVKISIEPETKNSDKNFALLPGMSVEVDIKTGTK